MLNAVRLFISVNRLVAIFFIRQLNTVRLFTRRNIKDVTVFLSISLTLLDYLDSV